MQSITYEIMIEHTHKHIIKTYHDNIINNNIINNIIDYSI